MIMKDYLHEDFIMSLVHPLLLQELISRNNEVQYHFSALNEMPFNKYDSFADQINMADFVGYTFFQLIDLQLGIMEGNITDEAICDSINASRMRFNAYVEGKPRYLAPVP